MFQEPLIQYCLYTLHPTQCCKTQTDNVIRNRQENKKEKNQGGEYFQKINLAFRQPTQSILHGVLDVFLLIIKLILYLS